MADAAEATPTEDTPPDTSDLVIGADGKPVEATPPADPPTDTSPEPPAPQHDPEVVETARSFGWKSPEEWNGDLPPNYVDDPNAFVERVQRGPLFRKMQADMDAMQSKMTADFEQRMKTMQTVNDKVVERMQKDHDAKLAELRADKRKAAHVGDMDTYDALDKQEQELQQEGPGVEPQPAEPAPQGQEGPQSPEEKALLDAYKAWAPNNTWFVTDQKAQDEANRVFDGLSILEPAARFEAVDKHMRQVRPDLFGAQPNPEPPPNPGTPQPMSSSRGATPPNQQGFGSLPQEAREQFMVEVKRGTFEDTEEGKQEYYDLYQESIQ